MRTALVYILLSGLAGGTLAGGLNLAQYALGVSAEGPRATATSAGLGLIAAGVIFALVWRARGEARSAAILAEKRPRQRLQGNLRARLSPKLRWQATTADLRHLLGRDAGQLHGQSLFNVVHPEDVPRVDEVLQQAHADRRRHSVRCRLLPKDLTAVAPPLNGVSDTGQLPVLNPGAFIYVRLLVQARRDAQGQVTSLVCHLSDDASALRRSEATLRQASTELTRARRRMKAMRQHFERLKESYRNLYHNSPVMYFSLDVKGRLVTFSDTLLHSLGYKRHKLAQKPYAALLDPALLPERARHTPSREGEFESRWRRRDGSIIAVWVRTVAVFDEKGGTVRYRSAALDLTERTRLATELRSRGDELERANGRLRQINSELEDFTYVVSHDLKEPLRTLQAYSHILAEEHSAQLGTDGFQYINHMVRASRRLGLLIDELLKLSQAGHTTRPPRVFNLIEAVATARQDLVDLIQRKEAMVLTEGSLPDIIGDPYRIVQLITNLIANGLKYNQNPAPKVVIGTQPSDSSRRVVIFVRDNGIGIDPTHHEQIFGIFRRLHQSDQYEGTGAGLAICKKIVEAHNGKIWVESRRGEGATFLFTLPRAPADTPAAPGALAPEESSLRQVPTVVEARTPRPQRAPEHPQIVLVEDMVDVGMIIRKLGQKSGLNITWFTTAEEAWDYLQQHHPDFLLFDINLPGMSGVDLCQRVRTLPSLKDTPIALFSQDQDPARHNSLFAAGATFLLSKDLLCQPAMWQDKLRELLASAVSDQRSEVRGQQSHSAGDAPTDKGLLTSDL
jgi:PAS domain S-box-containing protein